MTIVRVALLSLLVLIAPAGFSQEEAPQAEAAPEAGEAAPSEDVKSLEAFLDSEEQAVDALRTFDLAHTALADSAREKLAEAASEEEANQLTDEIKRRYGLVRAAYELGLDRYPNSARLQNFYGETLYDKFGEQDTALRAWHKAIGLNAKLSNPYNNIGLHNFHTGQYASGLEYMDQALKLDPKHPDYLYNMVQLYLIHGPQVAELRKWKPEKVYREAMKMSKEIVKVQPGDYHLTQDYAVNFFKAEDFGVEADWKEAARAWQEARKLVDRQDLLFFTWLNEARVWLFAKEFAKAKECAQEALKILPESAPAQTILGRAQAGLNPT